MALMKLDSQKFQDSIGEIRQVVNSDILDLMSGVATTLQNTGDDNQLVAQQLENCKKFQGSYNVFLEGTKGFLGELEKCYDISEYISKKADIGGVQSRDTGFANKQIDGSKFRI